MPKLEMAEPKNTGIDGVDNPKLDEILGKDVALEMREEVELIRETTTPFDLDAFLAGKQTPVFFGSAISNFGNWPSDRRTFNI
jgi:peptide chain release factor 3